MTPPVGWLSPLLYSGGRNVDGSLPPLSAADGSCCLVAGVGVLTAAHCVIEPNYTRDRRRVPYDPVEMMSICGRAGGRVRSWMFDGPMRDGILHIPVRWDIACVDPQGAVPLEELELAAAPPAVGEQLVWTGIDREWRAEAAPVTVLESNGQWLKVSWPGNRMGPGDSGAPMLNADGRLVGILSHSLPGRHVVAQGVGAIREFLDCL